MMVVYQFLNGFLYGSAWGCVTPFPAPGTAAAKAEAVTGIFRPIPPFSSFSAILSNGICLGCLLGIQRLNCKSLELVRKKQDMYNDIFGFVMMYPYYTFFLNQSEARLIAHNRAVASFLCCSIIYANVVA